MVPVQLVAITLVDGRLSIMKFAKEGRCPTLPYGAIWKDSQQGWTREPTNENVFAEVSKTFGDEAVKFRLVNEKDLPSDLSKRSKWVDNGKAIRSKE